MMDTFTVSFFGHRVIENPLAVERRLETLICELLTSHGYRACKIPPLLPQMRERNEDRCGQAQNGEK